MRLLTIVGVLLMALGVAGLVAGGISWTKNREKAELGPIAFEVTEKEELEIHPAIGGLLLLAGMAVIVVGSRRRA
jgi:hypothetical protein